MDLSPESQPYSAADFLPGLLANDGELGYKVVARTLALEAIDKLSRFLRVPAMEDFLHNIQGWATFSYVFKTGLYETARI